MQYARLVERLDETLGNEGVEQLCSIDFLIEVVQMNGKKASLLCMAIGIWVLDAMCILLMNCAAVWKLMIS